MTTGVEMPHTDGRIYAQVRDDTGKVTFVPKDELVMSQSAPPAPETGGLTTSMEATTPPPSASARRPTAELYRVSLLRHRR